MALLDSSGFESVVNHAWEHLENLSNVISRYCGEDARVEFIQACRNLDHETANRVLDKAIAKISGRDAATDALAGFARKFPQIQGLADDIDKAGSEKDKILALAGHHDKINEILSDNLH
jgi:hypothetical protein